VRRVIAAFLFGVRRVIAAFLRWQTALEKKKNKSGDDSPHSKIK